LRSGFEIPDPDEEIIDKQVRQLLEYPDAVQLVLERSSYYLYYIIEEVEARDLPSELALLPFVESAFNPKAISPAKAAGMWQFMPATGKSFKLKQNMFLDERADIVKSTRAALEYLQRLNEQFGNWHLALAAYNWGEGSLGKDASKKPKGQLT
jgi:membrane-bound lytic murein transglycosylase D